MPITARSKSCYVPNWILSRWRSLDRGWKAALIGFGIVLGHLVVAL